MTENEFLLIDRLNAIKDTINKYGEDKFYLSFSGGKDSTVVHYLLDMALPGNKIPRVFCDTGIEYNAIGSFVRGFNDERFIIIYPKKNIRETLQNVGYPFKSKEHSQRVFEYQRNRDLLREGSYLYDYVYGTGKKENSNFCCPKALRYQFTDQFDLKISHFCCNELKKKPFKKYEEETGRSICITGMMRSEGGQRTHINCLLTRNGKVIKFHPLAKVDGDWENWFINEYNIKLCDLYYPPYNFERTGCKGCPFGVTPDQLESMDEAERKQCETIWKPVYDEYRRIGYRLTNEQQMKLF